MVCTCIYLCVILFFLRISLAWALRAVRAASTLPPTDLNISPGYLPGISVGMVYNLMIVASAFAFVGYVLDDIFFYIFKIKIFTTYLVCEIYFAIYYRWRRREIQKFENIEVISPTKRRELMSEWREVIRTLGSDILTGWFFGKPLAEIYRGNLDEFLTWALFNTSRPHCTPEQVSEVELEMSGIEDALNYTFSPGYNPTTKCMRNSLDEVKTAYRPLIFYIAIWCQNIASYAVVSRMGYVAKQAGGTRYWFRPARHSNSNSNDPKLKKLQPVVFLHGIGVGISQNLPLLRNLHEDREVYLVELPWVCLRLGEKPPSPDEFVRTIEFMLSSHGRWGTGACFIGHSYGTYAVAWVLRKRPKLVRSMMLIEPVCLLLFSYHVCYNFLYNPNNKIWGRSAMWLAGKEMTVAHTLTRHFWWQSNTLLVRDFPQFSCVMLSDNDFICPSRQIRAWLASYPTCNEYENKDLKTSLVNTPNSSKTSHRNTRKVRKHSECWDDLVAKRVESNSKINVDWLERSDHGYALMFKHCHSRVKERLFELDELVWAESKKNEGNGDMPEKKKRRKSVSEKKDSSSRKSRKKSSDTNSNSHSSHSHHSIAATTVNPAEQAAEGATGSIRRRSSRFQATG